ncbi:MAG: hypothetical protein DA328_09600 [Nitrososphaeraceae archaeon]|nr:hypothetical protein [Nitrososphaeraceae archaeon]
MVGEQEHLPITITSVIRDNGRLAVLVDAEGKIYPVDTVIEMITRENYDFIVESQDFKTQIIVKEKDGKAYLTTIGDKNLLNNLDNI